jgi:two-component system NarL family response regulator
MSVCSKKIRIIIADDHPVIREGVSALINCQKDMQVVQEAANGREAVQKFFRYHPDVLLLDLRMPQMNGIEVIRAILKRAPQGKIMVFSTYSGDEDIYCALQAGAKAYLLKDSPSAQLLESVRHVYSGGLSIPPVIGARLAVRMQRPKLSKRETDVTKLLVAGKSNKEIGASLNVAESTVKVHIGRILKSWMPVDVQRPFGRPWSAGLCI